MGRCLQKVPIGGVRSIKVQIPSKRYPLNGLNSNGTVLKLQINLLTEVDNSKMRTAAKLCVATFAGPGTPKVHHGYFRWISQIRLHGQVVYVFKRVV